MSSVEFLLKRRPWHRRVMYAYREYRRMTMKRWPAIWYALQVSRLPR